MPPQLIIQLILYCTCFILVWFGAGLVVGAIEHISRSWRLPPFIVSFFLLGILTSLPEITIGSIAVINNDPVIFAGNLLGGSMVLLLGVIPLLGILGNGVKMPTQLDRMQLFFVLILVSAPAFLTADQQIGVWEGVFLILLYLFLFLVFSFKQSLWERVHALFQHQSKKVGPLFFKILVGVLILLLASNQIVKSTLYFADVLRISPFFVSLIVVSLGTNIPEISIIFRSVFTKKKEIALADYLGSACANSLFVGVFTVLHGEIVTLPNHFLQRFLFLATGLVLFFFFARSRNTLSRKESLILFSLYLGFVLFELLILS